MFVVRFLCCLAVGVLQFCFSSCLVAFQCDPTKDPIRAYNLIPTAGCVEPPTAPNATEIYIQIVRPKTEISVPFISCRVEVITTIFHCGMHSHTSLAEDGIRRDVISVSEEECQVIHKKGIYLTRFGKTILGLDKIGVTYQDVQEIGSISGTSCQGETYYDAQKKKTYAGVIVTSSYEFHLRKGKAIKDLQGGKWVVGGSSIQETSRLAGFSPDFGYAYFADIAAAECGAQPLAVMYQGKALQMETRDMSTPEAEKTSTEVLVQTEEQVFMLTRRSIITKCGVHMWSTEHTGVYIVDGSPGRYAITSSDTADSAFQLSTYIDTKLAMVRKETKDNILRLHSQLVHRACLTRLEVTRNLVSLARTNPQEFAYRLTGNSPGFSAYVLGDLAYIIKCRQVSVAEISQTLKCYKEVAVKLSDEELYMQSHTRILQRIGTEIVCNSRVSSALNIGGTFQYFGAKGLSPVLIEEVELSTSAKLQNWTWVSAGSTEALGVITKDSSDKWQAQMLSPGEEEAAASNLLSRYLDNGRGTPAGSFTGMFGTDAITTLGERLSERLYSGYREFGIFCAGIVGIKMVFSVLCWVLDTSVNGVSLYQTLGCGLHLLWATLSSMTTFLLTKHVLRTATPPAEGQGSKPDDDGSLATETPNEALVSRLQSGAYQMTSNEKIYPTCPSHQQDV